MPYRSVTPQKAAALATGGAVLLDVREPAEWQAGHSPQACHTPLGQLADISVDRLVVTVCRPGAPSWQTAAFMRHYLGKRSCTIAVGVTRRSGAPQVNSRAETASTETCGLGYFAAAGRQRDARLETSSARRE
jgi:rhodanese-related sulfurtransferase